MLALMGEAFFTRLSFGIIAFCLPLYAWEIGLSIAEIGALMSANLAIAAVVKPLGGRVADRLDGRRSALLATTVRSILTLLFTLATAPIHLFGVQFARGGAKALRDPSLDVLIAMHADHRRLASAYAWYGTAKTLAGSIGKAGAGGLLALTASNFAVVFVVAWAVSVIPILLIARYVPGGARRSGRAARSRPQRPLRLRALAPYVVLGFAINASGRMLRSLLPLLAVEYAGLNEVQAGGLYVVAGVIILLSGPLFGWLSDHVSRSLVLATRSLANILSSALFLWVPNGLGYATGQGVDQIGKAAFRPAWGALKAEISASDPRGRARAMAVMSAGSDAGTIVGPVVGGLLWSGFGVVALLVGRMALSVATEIYAVWIGHRARAVPTGARDRDGPGGERAPWDRAARDTALEAP